MNGDPSDLVGRARIRIYAGCDPTDLMAEGDVIGYCHQPTLFLQHDDGTQSAWPVDLPREVVTTTEETR